MLNPAPGDKVVVEPAHKVVLPGMVGLGKGFTVNNWVMIAVHPFKSVTVTL
ncbi:MAG: hypothetical protein IPL22_06225 [Bacteroidetes bacterium]|nr:hypothetical protein [Bacteroidota bacterium]